MTDENLKCLWNKFSMGDPLTDQELIALHRQSAQALIYLEDRRQIFELAYLKAIQDHGILNRYLRNRGLTSHCDDGWGEYWNHLCGSREKWYPNSSSKRTVLCNIVDLTQIETMQFPEHWKPNILLVYCSGRTDFRRRIHRHMSRHEAMAESYPTRIGGPAVIIPEANGKCELCWYIFGTSYTKYGYNMRIRCEQSKRSC